MPYRATDNTRQKKAATRLRLLRAARSLLAEGGYAAVGIVPVARRAQVATGTVYRYFPSKSALAAEVFRHICEREVEVMRLGADAQASPSDRLEDVLSTFAERALRNRQLAHALIAEPVSPEVDIERNRFRKAYTGILSEIIAATATDRVCTHTDPQLIAAFLVGGVAQSLITAPPEVSPDTIIDSICRTAKRAVFGATYDTL